MCPKCLKEPPLCLCAEAKPMATRLHVLFLQHPQEPDKLLGTARLAQTGLENSSLKVGLSWPNLTKALGREATPARWGVLFLGGRSTGKQGEATGSRQPVAGIRILARDGALLPPDEAALE